MSAAIPASTFPISTGPTSDQTKAFYGMFTWKIENFSSINKRELQSNAFEIGSYKWEKADRPFQCLDCQYRRELEAVALKRQEELIWEEEVAGQAGNELKSKCGGSNKEKCAKEKKGICLKQLNTLYRNTFMDEIYVSWSLAMTCNVCLRQFSIDALEFDCEATIAMRGTVGEW
ncbi:MATH domain-containing protein [Musa troglodytarum]|uniref:MATH domain-containing protein n=1 Tax=Musa troglodytarum TaxID=320322 RepID=A0A9E7FLN2_9LILI|nr:MATH domain-containing protein [Musa troglodytarum]